MNGTSRRALLRAGLAAGIGLGVGVPFAFGAGGSASTGNVLRSRLPLPRAFTRPLLVPPVLRPVRSTADADYYEITQTAAMASIVPGTRTQIWGYNGIFPGPTIVSRRGRPSIVTHTNRLPVPSVVHLHGGRTPHDSDGYPIDVVNPVDMSYLDIHMRAAMSDGDGIDMDAIALGDVSYGHRTYTYPLDQRAATLWYHDHRMDFTGPSVWRGLAGFHLVRDGEEDALGLPSGARELLLMITDRSFDTDGSFRYPSIDGTLVGKPGVTGPFVAGVLGDVMLVNGAPWPVATVNRAKNRLRILNACNARRIDLRLAPQADGTLTQIGTDGGLLAAPIRHEHFELAPGQRLDAIVDFAEYRPGTSVTLLNDFGEGRMSQVMRFRIGEAIEDHFTIPDRLSSIETLTSSQAVATRTFRFRSGDIDNMTGWLINGQPFRPDTIAATCRLGTVEVWRLMTDLHHPVHLHLSPFQVLSRGISAPGAFDAGRKDTIDLRPAEEAAIAIRFDGYPGKYVFHCHNLEHEDMAMMANFVTN
jgi:spore coat protein A, manganese oxidase